MNRVRHIGHFGSLALGGGSVTKTGNGGTSYSATYNAQTNQVASGVTATYDANGNQMQTNFVSPMSYDANHNPVAAGSTSLTYDALGRLVEFGGKPVVYGPSGEKLAVFNGTAYTASIALPGGGEAYYTSGALTSLRRKDWLGSSRLATNWAHAVVSKAAYAPYGENYGGAGTTDLDFTGQTQSSVSTLFDFPARKYDPNAGRWTVPDPGGWSVVDPTNPQSFNRYAYVLNSPLNLTDPTGLDPCNQPSAADCEAQYDLAMQEAQIAQQYGLSDVQLAGDINMQQYSAEFANLASPEQALESFSAVLAMNAANNTGLYSPASDPEPQNKQPSTVSCSGHAYVMAGNPGNIGHQGFPGVVVTNGSAAIIPQQWTGQHTAGPDMRTIGAGTFGAVWNDNKSYAFNTLTQTISDHTFSSSYQAQAVAEGRAPGNLVLEVVGGDDLGTNANVILTMPNIGYGCPVGTHQIQ